MKRLLLSIAALTLLLAACKKSEDTISDEDMLRGGQWKRASLTATYRLQTGALTTENIYTPMDTCLKDNTLEFKVNYVGTERKNFLRCGVGDPDETTFNWEIYNSGNNIRLYNVTELFGGESAINAQVINLTANELSIQYRLIDVDSATHDMDTVTYADIFRK